MKRAIPVVMALMAVVVLAVGDIAAQRCSPGGQHRGPGWHAGSDYSRMYDVNTVETIIGTVVSVDSVVPTRGMSKGIHVTLETEADEVTVHVGPSWFLENQEIPLAVGDELEITGSMTTVDGQRALIAAEIVSGDMVLELRDEAGRPAWSGWRCRST